MFISLSLSFLRTQGMSQGGLNMSQGISLILYFQVKEIYHLKYYGSEKH